MLNLAQIKSINNLVAHPNSFDENDNIWIKFKNVTIRILLRLEKKRFCQLKNLRFKKTLYTSTLKANSTNNMLLWRVKISFQSWEKPINANSDNFGFRPVAIYVRVEFMSRWNYYEPNRNENDRGQTFRSQAKFAGRNERGSPRRGANGRWLPSSYCSQIECRLSVGSSRKSKEVEIGGPFSALDLPECIRLCHVVAVEAFLMREYDHKTLFTMEEPIFRSTPYMPLRPTLSSLRCGTHERVLGGLLYICMRIRKHAYMFAHTRSLPSNPLIGFIRASSITFSQGYTPLAIAVVRPNDAYLPR